MSKRRYAMKTVKTPFGRSFETGIETSLMLVTVNQGGGRTPWRILLPHQLYQEAVEKLPRDAEVEVWPLDPSSARSVTRQDR